MSVVLFATRVLVVLCFLLITQAFMLCVKGKLVVGIRFIFILSMFLQMVMTVKDIYQGKNLRFRRMALRLMSLPGFQSENL